MIALLSLLACAPKIAHLDHRPAPLPKPGPAARFELPSFERRTLSNGLPVVVATNREVPLWEVRVLFRVGGFADPVGKEGLASVTLDMMNEGAGELSAEDISRALKRLGSSLSTGADDDGSSISASGMKRSLAPTLDLLAQVLLNPTFPAQDWEVRKAQRIADLAASKEDPNGIASRVTPYLMYGNAYRGRMVTETSYNALTLDDMHEFQREQLGPQDAMIIVGGDLSADEVLPMLEARLAGWKSVAPAILTPDVALAKTEKPTMYLVDKPGAAQSIIRAFQPAPTRRDSDFYSMVVANEGFGGAFTSRINMNLREDKGYTYGARCSSAHRYGPSVWSCGASVQTAATGPSIVEVQREISAVLADRPLNPNEISFYRESIERSFPGKFESTGAILGEKASAWQYGLPDNWTDRYLPGIQAVTTETANATFKRWVSPGNLTWVVVGDLAVIRPDLDKLGLHLIDIDRDGQPIAPPTATATATPATVE